LQARGPTAISGHAPADRIVMGLLRVCADVVLIGAGTFRATLDHLWTPAHARRRGDHPGHLPDPRGELMPDVLMPRLSDTMEEGVLSQWVKREGDQVRKGDVLTVTEIAREAHDLTARARARKLTRDELSGGTFTVSNLGMYGIRQFTAVINPPQAAILAVGEAVHQPVVGGDQVTIATTTTVTLSIDHRAVDGATAARFLTDLRELIEQPLDIVL
jgi:pyruvate/2-oxoglutarate dehydrogenase complex dihydrolipoamide acyltransferase (E2) component